MIYIEYMEHDRSIPLERFRNGRDLARWPDPDLVSDGRPVAVLGRTLSLGPHPPYLTLWRCRALEDLEEWESYFRARQSLRRAAALNGIHLSHAGCYDEIRTGPPIGEGIQYIEYFRYGMPHEKAVISKVFMRRAGLYENGALNFVLCRMGPLGPEPGGLAIWTFPTHADMENIIVDHQWQKAIHIVRSGLYRRMGDEAA